MAIRPGPVAAVVLLAGLGTWVYVSEFRNADDRRKAEQAKDRAFAFERSDLRAIVLNNADGTLRLAREGDAWAIETPIATPADRDAVEGVLASLETARVERRLGAEGDRAAYGLDPAPMSVSIETATGPAQSVALGATSPIGGARFAALASGELAVVSASLGDVAGKDLFALRDKSLVALDPWKTKSLVLERGAETIAFEKRDTGWAITRPIAAPADGPAITDLLNALDRLRAARFVAERAAPADLKALGLEPPAVRMSVLQEGWDTARIVEFGGETDGLRHARVVGREAVVAVAADFWPKATMPLLDLRRRDAFGLSQYRLRAITIAKEGGPPVALAKGEEGKWSVSGPVSGTVAYDAVDTLVRRIADVRAIEFDDRPAAELAARLAARPALDVTLEQEPDAEGGAAPRQHLLFGAPAKFGRIPVKDGDWPSILWADGAALRKIGEQVDALVALAAAPPPAPAGDGAPAPAGDGAPAPPAPP